MEDRIEWNQQKLSTRATQRKFAVVCLLFCAESENFMQKMFDSQRYSWSLGQNLFTKLYQALTDEESTAVDSCRFCLFYM